MIASAAHAAPLCPARSVEVAQIHLASINASRKKCGLPLLTAAELAHEFADLDQTPAPGNGAASLARAKIRPTSSAEAQATADVRSAAAEAAIAAAEKILTTETKGKLGGELIAKGIEDVRKKLN